LPLTSLLATKLYIPPPPSNLVSRQRLIEILNQGFKRKLTLISAPAGFGKTTLLSECVASCELPLAWYSLDEGDNDPALFFAYFIAALQSIEQNIGRGILSLLDSSQPSSIESILTEIINQIVTISVEFVLVLDDYHEIESPDIDQAISFLLSNMPPQMHLVIATRTDPTFPLPRLRSRGLLTEIRVDDLRFSPHEVVTFLEKEMGLKISAEEIFALEERTEGWIAGLQLAATTMQKLKNKNEIRHFVKNFSSSNKFILDYLTDEVLAKSPEITKSFLLQTSILNRLSAAVCDTITEQDNSQELLETIEATNLFLISLDNERHWYRYHHLFRELLQSRLKRLSPNSIPDLHRRAIVWFSNNGLMAEAIEHCLKIRNFEQAAELIQKFWLTESGGGIYYTSIINWLESIPNEVHRAHPNLGVIHGWMLCLTEQVDAVEPRLKKIEEMATAPLPTETLLKIAAIRGLNAYRRDNVDEAIEISLQTLEALGQNPFEKDLEAYTGIATNLGHSYRVIGNINESKKWFTKLMDASQTKNNLHLTIMGAVGLVRSQILAGELCLATETCFQGLAWCEQIAQETMQGLPMPVTPHLYRSLIELYIEMNKLDEAKGYLEQMEKMSQQHHIVMNIFAGNLLRALLLHAQGDTIGALYAIRQVEQLPSIYQKSGTRLFSPVAAIRAQLILAQITSTTRADQESNLAQVEQWAKTQRFSTDGSISTINEEFELLVWVRLLIAQDRSEKALIVLGRMIPDAIEKGRGSRVIEMKILQALAYHALGNTAEAMVALESALTLAESDGCVRLFVNEGPPMKKMLRDVAKQGIATNYVNKLLNAFNLQEEVDQSPSPASTSQSILVETLSERELEVLKLLADGATNQEIAEELIIAVTTAKKHVSNIIGKLGVTNRTQAVARARELDLV
jgi:LuxR family maltose regulon positive regulatory protein